MDCLIIYEKADGAKFLRSYNNDYGRKIGDETAMGWKVVNVLYEYENNYYQYNKYIRLIRQKAEKERNKKKITKAVKKIMYNQLESCLRKMQRF